jgi:hypothetical protein
MIEFLQPEYAINSLRHVCKHEQNIPHRFDFDALTAYVFIYIVVAPARKRPGTDKSVLFLNSSLERTELRN